ncbi:response regulator transcription factor [Marinomonas mediterranea]|jgi:Response regulator containing a CheY-like receiver domain and an HTH DNA-binding domain|uniref:Two component transcriptional regulator, LuxR family n=1 Tax=Marinomonas mediterranea (strain ATCC 700492 / JCM 21426 / NBRC 103028 / MMB-1) TaxID=717774 RepID=F2JTD9_MARM1|nr:response regulator transcription factor [Marinomonas mediterranea]ADZ90357.1 two component transcriptional regulator, LuxR family [Marinomonas mediterranea MMB-1]WCN08414.1 response regulator [Marinomonas mediterranea]WCN12468.1 response regulator [Marinomonas mediterranea]WCN16540.1 response regulator [Marinomonas mediterranea MMB-1]
MSIKLLITDDHSIVREGLKQLFCLYDDIDVIDEADSGDALLKKLKYLKPDVVTLDMVMPGKCGIELIEEISEKHPDTPLLILSMHNEAQVTRGSLRAGAQGYLSKDCDASTLIEAVRKLASGGRYIHSDVAEKLAFELEPEKAPKHENLSKREFHVFCQLAKGFSITDIAHELSISKKTVSTHKFRLMQKMDFSSHSEIVRYALNYELIE